MIYGSERRSPLGGVYVPGVAREEPEVAIGIADSVLPFPVLGFVEVFDDFRANGSGVFVMRVHTFDEDGQALRRVAELGGGSGVWLGGVQHHVGGSEAHHDSGGFGGVAIAIQFGETEGPGEPGGGSACFPARNVRKDDIGGDGAVAEHSELGRAGIHIPILTEFRFNPLGIVFGRANDAGEHRVWLKGG